MLLSRTVYVENGGGHQESPGVTFTRTTAVHSKERERERERERSYITLTVANLITQKNIIKDPAGCTWNFSLNRKCEMTKHRILSKLHLKNVCVVYLYSTLDAGAVMQNLHIYLRSGKYWKSRCCDLSCLIQRTEWTFKREILYLFLFLLKERWQPFTLHVLWEVAVG